MTPRPTGTLTAEQVEWARQRAKHKDKPGDVPALAVIDVVRICDSHEALRAALARVQQERDAFRDELNDRNRKERTAIETSCANFNAIQQRAEAAEARVGVLETENAALRKRAPKHCASCIGGESCWGVYVSAAQMDSKEPR